MNYQPEGTLLNTWENQNALHSPLSIADACHRGLIVEAMATMCDSNHNLYVDLGVMQGMIPRTEGAMGIAEGTVRDIAIISRVGKCVSFVITSLTADETGKPLAICSRRKAQELCRLHYISHLVAGDIIPAQVTHLEPFGAFCDIGCGIPSLLPIDAISVSRISHPGDRLTSKDRIRAVVRSVDNGRITLSLKELLGTWEENAADFTQGQTVSGVIRSVEPYGIFVELAPNLAGLAEPRAGVMEGQRASVFIKNIIPSRMKIKLIIIDAFDAPPCPAPLRYFYDQPHMDRFLYSPVDCEKQITTYFDKGY